MTPSCSFSRQGTAIAHQSSPLPNAREDRGRQIARRGGIRRVGTRFAVPSQTPGGPATYMVDLVDDRCTCPDWDLRRARCKHGEAVLFWLAWEADGSAPAETETVKAPPRRYPRDWSAYNAAQKKEHHYLELLLRALCDGIPQPPRRTGPGRNPIPLRDAAFAALLKVYNLKAQRYMESILTESVNKGHLIKIPHYNTISNFLGDEASTPTLVSLIEESAKPLAAIENEAGQFAIDSTGFSTVTYDRWFDQKHGRLRATHPWIKLHIMVGTATLGITGVRVTPEGDAPQLPALTEQTRKHFTVKEVSADLAYSSKDNLEKLEQFGITPYIPFKVSAVVDPKNKTWSRLLGVFLFDNERFMQHFHRRSKIETVNMMIKSKFGGAVRSKTPVAQVNEVLAKCVLHNLCCLVKAIFSAGLAPKFWQDVPTATVTTARPKLTLVPMPRMED